jgi:mannose-6-phosphate isomerase-like protein (cupin superfamily)
MGPEYYGQVSNPNAIVLRRDLSVHGIEFYSPVNFSQQIGLMSRPKGYKVSAHIHNQVERTISLTQEVLFIRKGECTVKLYSSSASVTNEIKLKEGDVILLAHGGHEIFMNTDCEILEVKQGPYAGDNDKTQIVF